MSNSNLSSTFVDKVVQMCFDLYNQLPKTGKPMVNEWTVLSCIVKYDRLREHLEVVSLGTGSKCIGATRMSPKGDILNDSHAEIFARRGFLIYLYENIEKALRNQSSIFKYTNKQLKLVEQIDFIFYSSQLPCGDASIVPKSGNEEEFGELLPLVKHKVDDSDAINKKLKLEDDIYRTGAKCLPESEQDPKMPGKDYHLLGLVRTKPGRGDRTKSVSCSDKIAKWIHLGVQGSLLHMLCGSLYIRYFIFGAGTPYSKESLNRALLNRNGYDEKPTIDPEFYQTTLVFESSKTESNIRAAPGSIIWIKLNNPISQVSVQGKMLGITKKSAALPSKSLCISKYNIYKSFIHILSSYKELSKDLLADEDVASVPYNKMKGKSAKYYEQWLKIKENFFKSWTVKPDMWDFCIDVKQRG